MRKFKIGDRVKAIGSIDGMNLNGREGRVVAFNRHPDFTVGVEFDERMSGHSCGEHGKDGYCRNGTPRDFELIRTNIWQGKTRS